MLHVQVHAQVQVQVQVHGAAGRTLRAEVDKTGKIRKWQFSAPAGMTRARDGHIFTFWHSGPKRPA